jgi:hypothetical protein
MMRLPLSDVHIRLLRGVRAVIAGDPMLAPWMAAEAGPSLVIEDFESEPWASLTFSGTRHRLAIRLEGPPALVEAGKARLALLLDEPEIQVPGHFLADLALEAIPCREAPAPGKFDPDGHARLAIQMEALTIEE